MSIPAIFPPADTSGNEIYKAIVVDEGSYLQRDLVRGSSTEAALCIRVENLPDDVTALCRAVISAEAAFPTHPCDACLTLVSSGPMFGHTRLLGNSMVVGRMMTTDAGHACKLVNMTVPAAPVVSDGTTGSTGAVVLVRLTYRYPQKLLAL